MAENSNIDDIKAPLLAALGAADLALATVNELITNLRERAEETRTDTRSRVEESRARLTKLQEDLPEQLTELREKFTAEVERLVALAVGALGSSVPTWSQWSWRSALR